MRALIFSAMASGLVCAKRADALFGFYASSKQISHQDNERYDKGLEIAFVEFLVIRGYCQANQSCD